MTSSYANENHEAPTNGRNNFIIHCVGGKLGVD